MDVWLYLTGLLASGVRLATPLIFASSGGLFSERAGVINIGLEGILLVGAFAGAVGAYWGESPWIGLLAGAAAGTLIGFLHAAVCVYGRADQIVAGTAINILAVGLTSSAAKVFFGVTGSTPALSLDNRFGELRIPWISGAPFLGPVFFRHIPLVYIAPLIVVLTHVILARTRFGLRLHAVGEAPHAAETQGVAVRPLRLWCVVLGSAVAALGGVFLSVGHASAFARNMSAGRGFIALAALILGNWKPVPVLGASLLFGLGEALAISLQGVAVPGLGLVPVQFVQMVPYVVTLAALAGFAGRPRPPSGLGKPYPV